MPTTLNYIVRMIVKYCIEWSLELAQTYLIKEPSYRLTLLFKPWRMTLNKSFYHDPHNITGQSQQSNSLLVCITESYYGF